MDDPGTVRRPTRSHPVRTRLQQLGITFIAARSPQGKGRVERLWGVLQDRLTSELRLAQAGDLDSANAVLIRFIGDYNRRFARRPRETATLWRPAPHDLDRICCFVHLRVVSNDNLVQWEGRRFQIPPQARRFSFAGAKVHLYQALDGRVALYHGETKLPHNLASPGGHFHVAVRVTKSRCYNISAIEQELSNYFVALQPGRLSWRSF